jgi:hypothetical protein
MSHPVRLQVSCCVYSEVPQEKNGSSGSSVPGQEGGLRMMNRPPALTCFQGNTSCRYLLQGECRGAVHFH